MQEFWVTIERKDGTIGQYLTSHNDVVSATRYVARSLDIADAKKVHIVLKEDRT